MTHTHAMPGRAARLFVWAALMLTAVLAYHFLLPGNPAVAQGSHVVLADLGGPIDSVAAGYVSRAVDTAGDDGASALVLRVDTPGGAFDATLELGIGRCELYVDRKRDLVDWKCFRK